MREEKLTTFEQDLITVELYWREKFPHLEIPESKFIKAWLRWYQLSELFSAFNSVNGHNRTTDEVGKIISGLLRKRHSNFQVPETARTLRFDENGKRYEAMT